MVNINKPPCDSRICSFLVRHQYSLYSSLYNTNIHLYNTNICVHLLIPPSHLHPSVSLLHPYTSPGLVC